MDNTLTETPVYCDFCFEVTLAVKRCDNCMKDFCSKHAEEHDFDGCDDIPF